MAKRKARRRTGPGRTAVNGSTMTLNVRAVPQALLGAVDGVGVVAVGALQLARDVVLSGLSGVANIGTEALRATVAGARGVVSAASQTVADVAVAVRNGLRTTIGDARQPRRNAARPTASRRGNSTSGTANAAVSSTDGVRPRRRGRRTRSATRPARSSIAA
jgi:hypothetical protein